MRLFLKISGLYMALVLALSFLSGCSGDDSLIDLSGYWSGKVKNPTAKSGWPMQMYISQDGQDIFAVYQDYRGIITARNVHLDGDIFSFVIDIYPDTVTFIGDVRGTSYITGEWSFSGDGNNGSWYLTSDTTNFSRTTPDDSTTGNASNPFSRP